MVIILGIEVNFENHDKTQNLMIICDLSKRFWKQLYTYQTSEVSLLIAIRSKFIVLLYNL